MNKPTEGPFGPTDHAPLPDRPGDPTQDLARNPAQNPAQNPELGAAWTDALRALQSVARPPGTAGTASESSADTPPPAPRPATSEAPPVDEALAALQDLARRYSPPHSPEPAADQPGLPPAEPGSAMPGASDNELSADAYDEPTPSARRLQGKRSSWASVFVILLSAAVLAMLLVGATSLWQFFQAGTGRTPAERTAAPGPDVAESTIARSAPSPSTTVVTVAPPTVTGAPDLAAIERAMEDCDTEAAKNPDALYFLIVPAVSPAKDYSAWAPRSVGDIGTSVILLRSKDALDGLRSRSLTVYSDPYRFAIIDATTEATQEWPAVTGVAKFIKLDAAAIAGFRVRFGFSDFVGDTPSNFRFPRNKGVCYWVSALLRT